MSDEETGFAPDPGAELDLGLPPHEKPGTVWRTGRHVGRTIYAQSGPEPSDEDVLIGVMDTRELAAEACEGRNMALRLEPADPVAVLRDIARNTIGGNNPALADLVKAVACYLEEDMAGPEHPLPELGLARLDDLRAVLDITFGTAWLPGTQHEPAIAAKERLRVVAGVRPATAQAAPAGHGEVSPVAEDAGAAESTTAPRTGEPS
jgi:hypothetical protein